MCFSNFAQLLSITKSRFHVNFMTKGLQFPPIFLTWVPYPPILNNIKETAEVVPKGFPKSVMLLSNQTKLNFGQNLPKLPKILSVF